MTETKYPIHSEDDPLLLCFGDWLRFRRKQIDLTQAELAARANCSVTAVRKIESSQRRPSKQLAGSLARALEISTEDQANFIKVARGELSVNRLFSYTRAEDNKFRPYLKRDPIPRNLPGMLTPFIGREPELAAVGQLLGDPHCRLLTLTGSGGVGKTRLAIEVARRHNEIFPDGTWFVPLAPLSSSEFLISTIADVLNFRFQDFEAPREQLLGYLHGINALLILDNVEHLLDGVMLFKEILELAPRIRLLTTSRERLNLQGEWVFEIQGLPVPPSDEVEKFEEYSSVALFIQSAQHVQAGFELRNDERPWMAQICQMLEGLPLGIELAAGWVRMLSCEEIAREIERDLDFLSGSVRDIPERHRSLRATLDHSWNLLTAEEKLVFSRLSVFRGGFHREAAEDVCGSNLTILSSLKNKSLLRFTDRKRYDLHELIHQYAALRLAENPYEAERIKDRHAIHYARKFSEWETALKGSRQIETLDEMADDIDNLRQAWQQMVSCCKVGCDESSVFSLSQFQSAVFSLSLFYELRCRYWEAVSLFSQATETLKAAILAASEQADFRCIDPILGIITAYLGYHQYLMHYLQGRESLEEALKLLEHDPSKVGRAQGYILQAWVYQARGHYQDAADLFQRSAIVFRQENNEWWYTLTISMLAIVNLGLGKLDESLALFQESLPRIEAGDLYLGVQTMIGLGYVHFLLGDLSEAQRVLQESLELSYQSGNKRQTAYNQRILGQIAIASGQYDPAKEYLQESVNQLSHYGDSPDLAIALVYLGKCLVASQEMETARREIQKAIRIGRTFNILYLTYWGLTNLARIFMEEGQQEPALEIALVLKKYSVDPKIARDEYSKLLADLQTRLSPKQIDAATERTEGMGIESLLIQI